CCSSQTWVMPTFSPTMALVATFLLSSWRGTHPHTDAPLGCPRAERSTGSARGPRHRALRHVCCTAPKTGIRSRRPAAEATPHARLRASRQLGRRHLEADPQLQEQPHPVEVLPHLAHRATLDPREAGLGELDRGPRCRDRRQSPRMEEPWVKVRARVRPG